MRREEKHKEHQAREMELPVIKPSRENKYNISIPNLGLCLISRREPMSWWLRTAPAWASQSPNGFHLKRHSEKFRSQILLAFSAPWYTCFFISANSKLAGNIGSPKNCTENHCKWRKRRAELQSLVFRLAKPTYACKYYLSTKYKLLLVRPSSPRIYRIWHIPLRPGAISTHKSSRWVRKISKIISSYLPLGPRKRYIFLIQKFWITHPYPPLITQKKHWITLLCRTIIIPVFVQYIV